MYLYGRLPACDSAGAARRKTTRCVAVCCRKCCGAAGPINAKQPGVRLVRQ